MNSTPETNQSVGQGAPSHPLLAEGPTTGNPNTTSVFDARIYNAGLVFGGVTLVILLGVIKDVWALLKPSGQGQLAFGFLMLRYSSHYRVWFGYALTDTAAWYATIPHVALYTAAIYSLVTRRRWGWVLLSVYLLYIPLSEILYVLLPRFGYGDQPVIPAGMLWAHVPYFIILVVLVGLVEWRVWKYRDIFVY
jgi:hypothetical protein